MIGAADLLVALIPWLVILLVGMVAVRWLRREARRRRDRFREMRR